MDEGQILEISITTENRAVKIIYFDLINNDHCTEMQTIQPI